jgi:GntR family transcriptional regulator
MTPTVTLLGVVRVTDLPAYVAEVFDEEMIRRDRLMSADGQPAALSVSWIPASIADGTRLAEPTMMPEGTYAVLRQIGHKVTRAVETVRSRPAADAERKALRLPKGAPALAVERISYYAGGAPIEFLETVADATRVSIQHSIDL